MHLPPSPKLEVKDLQMSFWPWHLTLLPPSFTYKDSCDYTGHDWIIQDNTPSSYSQLIQFRSVAQSCPTLCNPMNRSTPGLPVHHQLRATIIPSTTLITLCHVQKHIHRFWKLRHGHPWGPLFSLAHYSLVVATENSFVFFFPQKHLWPLSHEGSTYVYASVNSCIILSICLYMQMLLNMILFCNFLFN